MAHTKKRPTESDRLEARFVGARDKIVELRKVAERLGLCEVGEPLTIAEVFPEYGVNPLGAALRGARRREGLTQRQLAAATGIPQRHISEMESGKRPIGKERARKLAEALHVADYRVFL